MKILLIGGSGGLGKLLSPELLKRKDYVVISLSSRDVDITNSYTTREIVRDYNPDVLINLAGVSIDSTIAKADLKDVQKQLNVNILGNIHLIQPFIEISKAKAFGRYIYISSILSSRVAMGAGIYSATKAFNDNLIRTSALENAKYGTTFNSVQLGYFSAGLCERLPENIKQLVLNKIPFRRWGRIEELANLIEYFINTEYSTGTNIDLSGGLHAGLF